DLLRVPETATTGVAKHGIILVVCPCLSVVDTVVDALVLVTSGLFVFYFMVMVGEYGYQRIAAEPGRIVLIDHGTPREDGTQAIGKEADGLFFPMHKVGACGMRPVHWPPNGTIGIMLKKQVVRAVMVHHPVRVVHPVCLWREMEVRAMFF